MSLFKWTGELSVNIKEIDRQHKTLVDTINQLWQAMKDGEAREVIGEILKNLVDYTHVHFTYEENLMEKHGYPELEEHRKKHAFVTGKVQEFADRLNHDAHAPTIELATFVKNWLQQHILGTDKKYGPFLKEKGAS